MRTCYKIFASYRFKFAASIPCSLQSLRQPWLPWRRWRQRKQWRPRKRRWRQTWVCRSTKLCAELNGSCTNSSWRQSHLCLPWRRWRPWKRWRRSRRWRSEKMKKWEVMLTALWLDVCACAAAWLKNMCPAEACVCSRWISAGIERLFGRFDPWWKTQILFQWSCTHNGLVHGFHVQH